ncbi:hypothetical protein QOZ80_8AG0620940 [Eleusine coracana subsp. coracana]|nr:hypothetical protein QOZ80_8AG0620940 [Eleusine coracana subsp. coracana]
MATYKRKCMWSSQRGLAVPAMSTRKKDGVQLIVGVYVDDLVITGANCDGIREFKMEMPKAFRMSDLSLLHYYLGIEVKQSAEGISLRQGSYALKILDWSSMADCKLNQAPMEALLKLSKLSDKELVDATEFHSIVGSLRYLVNTHPDLAFAVGYVSPFVEAVKKILRYVAGTWEWGLWLGRKKQQETCLIGFSDSDYAGDVDARKSTTGVIFFFGDSPIT